MSSKQAVLFTLMKWLNASHIYVFKPVYGFRVWGDLVGDVVLQDSCLIFYTIQHSTPEQDIVRSYTLYNTAQQSKTVVRSYTLYDTA